MKYVKAVAVLTFIASLLTVMAFTENRDFEIKVGKKYTCCYREDEKEKLSRIIDIDEDELDSFFDENSIDFMAVKSDKASQIRISSYENDFSKTAGDMSSLTTKEIKSLANEMVKGTDLKYSVYKTKEQKFIRISQNLSDSGGDFLATQFVTVGSGRLYNITFYNNGDYLPKESYKILDSFYINEEIVSSKKPIAYLFIVAFLIATFSVVIILMIFGIVKDKKGKTEEVKEDE